MNFTTRPTITASETTYDLFVLIYCCLYLLLSNYLLLMARTSQLCWWWTNKILVETDQTTTDYNLTTSWQCLRGLAVNGIAVSVFSTLPTNGRFSALYLSRLVWSQQQFLKTMPAWWILIRKKPVVGFLELCCCWSCGEVHYLLKI